MIRQFSIVIGSCLVLAGACGTSLGGSDDGGGGTGGDGAGGTNFGGTGGTQPGGSGGTASGGTGGTYPGDTGGAPTGGTGGIGGRGGVTGGGGRGGAGAAGGGSCAGQGGGGGCIACSPSDLTAPVETCLLAADGTAVLMSLTAAVTVVSFDQVPGPNCDRVNYSGSTANSARIVVEDSSAQRWSIFIRVPNLPVNLVQPGDALDLRLTGGYTYSGPGPAPTQVISLSRGGKVLMFGYVGGALEAAIADGVSLQAAGIACGPGVGLCTFIPQKAQVTVGASQSLIDPGHTGIVGDLEVTVDRFHRFSPGGGGCDGADSARVGGYSISGVGP